MENSFIATVKWTLIPGTQIVVNFWNFSNEIKIKSIMNDFKSNQDELILRYFWSFLKYLESSRNLTVLKYLAKNNVLKFQISNISNGHFQQHKFYSSFKPKTRMFSLREASTKKRDINTTVRTNDVTLLNQSFLYYFCILYCWLFCINYNWLEFYLYAISMFLALMWARSSSLAHLHTNLMAK